MTMVVMVAAAAVVVVVVVAVAHMLTKCRKIHITRHGGRGLHLLVMQRSDLTVIFDQV